MSYSGATEPGNPTDVDRALYRLNVVCPDYQEVWRDRQTRDRTEGFGPPDEYIQTADLADWVVRRMAAKQYSCFAEFSAEVEDLLTTGSRGVRQLVTIGLLEDIQNLLGDGQSTLDDVGELLRFFGPQTSEAWMMVASWRERPQTRT